jgi:glycosyltransferase involved in cell wall biosynthesis
MSTLITKKILTRNKKVRIYYSIVDNFPPFRVDVAELFGRCLASMELDIEWYMARDKPGRCGLDFFEGQKANLPTRLMGNGVLTKVVNKVFYWICDFRELFRCLFKPLDLIQVRDKYFAALLGLLIARMKGIKFVYWCSYPFPEHDLESVSIEKGIKRYLYFLRGWFGKWALYRLVMQLSDHVFVQSEQMKRDIAAYGVPEEKMTAVPMGVPDKIFDTAQARQCPIQPGQIVYIGTLAAVRRMQVLIEAFAEVHGRFPDARLVIVGEGDMPWERPSLEQHAQQLGLDQAIRFTGFLPIEQAWEIAAAAQCCVSPIYPTPVLNAGSPTKLVEYMALGRPVVCNDHPEQSEIIQESGAGLCVRWGAHAFAGAMIWMLEHPEEAEAMGAKGPAWVAGNRSYPHIAKQVWAVYENLLVRQA